MRALSNHAEYDKHIRKHAEDDRDPCHRLWKCGESSPMFQQNDHAHYRRNGSDEDKPVKEKLGDTQMGPEWNNAVNRK